MSEPEKVIQGRNLTWDDDIDWVELGVFTDPSVKWELLAMLIGSVIFFYVQFKMAEFYVPFLAELLGGPKNTYSGMKPKVQGEYVSRVVSDIHSFISLAMSWYGCFYVCDDPSKTIFNDYECSMTPHRI